MKFNFFYWIALIVSIGAFLFPTYMTYEAPYHDGVRVYGFPLNFFSEGGFCAGVCVHDFLFQNLLIDIAFIIFTPLILNFIVGEIGKTLFSKK